MLYKLSDENAAMLDTSSRKTLSTMKHVIALLNNNLFMWFYIITLHKYIHPIFQPQYCTITDPDTGLKHEFLLGHGSNDPWFLHAGYVPLEVSCTFVCIPDTSTANIPTCYRSCPIFSGTDITGTTTLNIQEDISYMVVLPPSPADSFWSQ